MEMIPYEDGFDYDEDESILFAAEAWINCDDVSLEVKDSSVHFPLADLLTHAITQIDEERLPEDKEMLIDYLLPVLRNAVAELEKRQEALSK